MNACRIVIVCYSSVFTGEMCIVKDAAGVVVNSKVLPIPYADFARRVMRSRKWQLLYAGPGSFHFMRIAR